MLSQVFSLLGDSKLSKDDFTKLYEDAWKIDYGYLLMDKSKEKGNIEKYRKSLHIHICDDSNENFAECLGAKYLTKFYLQIFALKNGVRTN